MSCEWFGFLLRGSTGIMEECNLELDIGVSKRFIGKQSETYASRTIRKIRTPGNRRGRKRRLRRRTRKRDLASLIAARIAHARLHITASHPLIRRAVVINRTAREVKKIPVAGPDNVVLKARVGRGNRAVGIHLYYVEGRASVE